MGRSQRSPFPALGRGPLVTLPFEFGNQIAPFSPPPAPPGHSGTADPAEGPGKGDPGEASVHPGQGLLGCPGHPHREQQGARQGDDHAGAEGGDGLPIGQHECPRFCFCPSCSTPTAAVSVWWWWPTPHGAVGTQPVKRLCPSLFHVGGLMGRLRNSHNGGGCPPPQLLCTQSWE